MQIRLTILPVVLLLFGNAAAHGPSKEVQTMSIGARAGDNERKIQQFVVNVAQWDLRDLRNIEGSIQGKWQLAPSSRDRSVGWIMHETKVVEKPEWLQSAYLLAYAEADAQGKNDVRVVASRLIIEVRDDVCFSGTAVQRKYDRGTPSEKIAAQPRDGVGSVSLLSIAGRNVDLRYRSDNGCVWQVTFYDRRADAR